MHSRFLSWILSLIAITSLGFASESPAERDARMHWWRTARFGMFVHWGLYSGLAGTWEGQPVGTRGGMEWIQERVKADTDTYARAAIPKFTPQPGFATAWARLAKAAGCQYVVFTTKHHDGFALHDSAVSDFDAGTVLQRDLVREIVDALRAEGLRVGFYHSVIDWHHDQYEYARSAQLPHPLKGRPYPNGERHHDRYQDYLYGEVRELVTNYGPIDILWWDYSSQDFQGQEAWRAFDLMTMVRERQPAVIMNNRLFRSREAGWASMGTEGFLPQLEPKYGDFITPEQHIPATGMPGVDWETCMTLNTTWGYSDHDQAWKDDPTLIRNLIDIASKGGNYLLNIGPKGDGSIPAESVRSLEAIGAWMKVNGGAIRGTGASPFEKLAFGRCTTQVLPRGNTRLYLHVFDWPADGQLVVPGLASKPRRAFLLAGGSDLTVSAGEGQVTIQLPEQQPDPIATVVALDIVGAPQLVAAPAPRQETRPERDARMAWWREAKFGMFIHWGVYAVPGGFYRGQPVGGIGEWILRNAQIPVAEYRAFAREFNPVKFDPEAWAQLAQDAGMKYIVITAKHHDGFALYPSDVTDWDVADATPYGQDLLTPLARAARRHGLKFGTYYSQAQDWTHPGGAKAGLQEGEGWDPAHRGSFDTYLKTIAVPQTREILTRIQPDILWWDTPVWMTPERAAPLFALTALRPGLITNNRLGGGYPGDTETPEQHIPATGYADRDWETCMTLNDTWGYKSDDHNWKSTETLVRNLIDIVSKGGNYLLNVGPTAEGEIPPPSIERLRAVGVWMQANHAAVYGTAASPFRRLPWGRCTQRTNGGHTTLYLHVFDWPADGRLKVPGLKNPVQSASLLASGKSLSTESTQEGPVVNVPLTAPDALSSTVVLRLEGAPEVEQVLWTAQADDGSITLSAADATLHGGSLQVEHSPANLGYWVDAGDWAEWQFKVTQPGRFKVRAETASTGSAALEVGLGEHTLRVSFPNTGDYGRYQVLEIGTVELQSGTATLQVKPVRQGWQPVNLRSLTLLPIH